VNSGSDERVTVAELSLGAEAWGSRRAEESKGGEYFSPLLLAPPQPCTEVWEARVSLKEGIGYTYPWIEGQVRTLQRSNVPAFSA